MIDPDFIDFGRDRSIAPITEVEVKNLLVKETQEIINQANLADIKEGEDFSVEILDLEKDDKVEWITSL